MKNHFAGILVICIAALMAYIILLFNSALTSIISGSNSAAPSCPLWDAIAFQTNVSIGLTIFVVLIGLYLFFFSREEKIVEKVRTVKEVAAPEKLTKERFGPALAGMDSDEKAVFEKLVEGQGTMFQSELVDKTALGKVKVTRILDRLEGRGLIERKRRGMSNVVVLKH